MQDAPDLRQFLAGGADVGARMRARDWTGSPLGPPERWPEALKTLVSVMLGSTQAMFVAWGEARAMLYNQAYADLLQDRHPAALGARFAEVWHDILADIGPVIDRAFAGLRTQMDDMAVDLIRDGRLQEAHFSFSYTPVRGPDGRVAGMFCACREITDQVVAQRGAEAERRRQRLMLQQMPGFAALLSGPDHRFDYVNDAYVEICGARDYLGRSLREVFPELEGQGFHERLDQAFADGRSQVVRAAPVRFRNPDRDHFVDFVFAPVRDDEGRVSGIFIGGYDATEAFRANAQLQESESRFRNMADHSPVMMWVTDRSGACTYLNRAWYEFTGQTEAAALGAGWLDAVHPEDRAAAERAFGAANDRAEPFRIEYRLKRADGAYRWSIDAASPRFSDDGRGFLGYVGSIIDIGDRREAEEALASKADELAAVLDTVPAVIWIARDATAGRIDGNAAARRMLRLPPGVNQSATAPPHERPGGFQVFDKEGRPLRPEDLPVQRAARGETIEGFEETIRFEDGRSIVLLGNAAPLRDAVGRPRGAVAAFADVTAIRAAEAELRRLNTLLETRVAEALAERRLLAEVVEKTSIFIQVVGLDWRWLAINAAAAGEFERIFGVRPKAGDDMRELLASQPEHVAAVMAVWSRALAGEEFTETAEFGDPTRDRRTYEMRYYALTDAEGRRIGAYQFVTDVSLRVAEQRQLLEIQKLETIGHLTGGVAHDFNNLLAAILSNLDLARKRIEDPRTAKLVDGAVRGAERGAALTRRLLAFARRQELLTRRVAVPALFSGMRELLERSLGPEVRIDGAFPDDLPDVLVDPHQLELAFLNLAVNARDAMPSGGVLTVEAEARSVSAGDVGGLGAGAYVRIAVRDTGVGMDAATLKSATDPFFTTKGVGKGTGLGLSMVQGLAAQSGGVLKLASAPGCGTTVELWLPCAPGAQDALPSAAAAPAQPAARPLKILVVDDDMLVGMGTAAMLEDLGHVVIEASSGAAALDLHAAHDDVDIVVTDHAMPGMTGTELAAALAARDPALPVILATGYAELPNGTLSPLPRLSKPFRQEDLEAALARVRSAARAGSAARRAAG